MRPETQYFSTDVKVHQRERDLQSQVKDHEKVLRKSHPDAVRISNAIINRSIDNTNWEVQFFINN